MPKADEGTHRHWTIDREEIAKDKDGPYDTKTVAYILVTLLYAPLG